MANKFILALLLFCFIACSESFDQKYLLGQWETTSWIENGTGQVINNKMDFDFNDDRKYSIDYGTLKESGTYYISGGFLHTTETGKAEKKVKLIKVVQDSIIFEMNRGGAIETVMLSRRY